eukprot:m.1541609 g.1541609  ORF g.1541609 m.1541609 type:complete len:4012 (+) comp25251_c0_seq2:253-12288(+)
MFEGLVTWALAKYLGKYIENFDKSKLSINVYKGDVELQDLILRSSALEDIDMPVTVKWGKLGLLSLRVSWKSLLSKPITVVIDEVYIVAVPGTESPYDAEKEAKRKEEIKQALIESMESELNPGADDGEGAELGGSVFRVINNVQVTIKRIHIRYEDSGVTNGTDPFTCGLTLGELSAVSATDAWEQCKMGTNPDVARKLLRLQGLALYWNPSAATNGLLSKVKDRGAISTQFRGITHTGAKCDALDYIVNPIATEGRITINKKSMPQHEISLDIKAIAIGLTDMQYASVLKTADYFTWLSLRESQKHRKPKNAVKGNAGLWWKFAYEASVADFRRRTTPWAWSFIRRRRDVRRDYLKLFTQKLTHPKKVDKALNAQLSSLEHGLSAEDIVRYRNIARAQMPKKPVSKKSGGWFGWGSKKSDEHEEEVPDIHDSYKRFQELMAGETQLEKAKSIETVGLTASVKFAETSISLKEVVDKSLGSAASAQKNLREILRFSLAESVVQVRQRPVAEALWANVQLGQYSIYMIRRSGQLTNIVTPLESRHVAKMNLMSDITKTMEIEYETKPLQAVGDIKPDVSVKALLRPAEWLLTAPGITCISNFFSTADEVEAIDFDSLYSAAVDGVSSQTRSGLMHLVEERQIMDVYVHVEAPLLILPARDTDDANALCAFVDLGVLRLTSDLRGKSTQGMSEKSDEEIKKEAYDKFDIRLDGMQVLIGTRADPWRESLLLATSPLHILNEINVNVTLEKFLHDYDTELASMKVHGAMPRLQLVLSSKHIVQLIELGKSLTEEFGGDSESPSSAADVSSSATRAIEGRQEREASTPGALVVTGLTPQQIKQRAERRKTMALNKVLQFAFEFVDVSVTIAYFSTRTQTATPFLSVGISNLSLQGSTRKFDQRVQLKLSGMHVISYLKEQPVYLLHAHGQESSASKKETTSTALATRGAHGHFFEADLVMSDPTSPCFDDEFHRKAMKVKLFADVFEVLADQETICLLMHKMHSMVKQIKTAALDAAVNLLQDDPNAPASVAVKPAPVTQASTKPVAKKFEGKDFTAVDAKFSFKVFRAKLRAAGTDLMALEVASLSADFIQMESSAVKASAQLQSLELTELTVDPSVMHANIVSIAGSNVLKANFEQFATPATDGATGRVSLNLGQLRFVLIKQYLDSLTNFMGPITLASESLVDDATEITSEIAAKTGGTEGKNGNRALAEALGNKTGSEAQSKTMALLKKLSVAAERDMTRGQGTEESSDVAKFKLNVVLQAPLILVPVTAQSEHALAANLGKVTVTNAFVGDDMVVLDKMHVALSGVRVSRVEFYPGETMVTAVHDIATMQDVVAKVDRAVECKVHAVDGPVEMVVGVSSEAAEISLAKDDIQFVLDVLDHNLTASAASVDAVTDIAPDAASLATRSDSGASFSDTASMVSSSDFGGEESRVGAGTSGGDAVGGDVPAVPNNGMSASVSFGCLKMQLLDQQRAPFAVLTITGVGVDMVQDIRGVPRDTIARIVGTGESEPTTSGKDAPETDKTAVMDMVVSLKVQDLVVKDVRSENPEHHTEIVKRSRHSSASGDETALPALVDVRIKQGQRALRIYQRLHTDPDTEPLTPIAPNVLRPFLSQFGDVAGIYTNACGTSATLFFSGENPAEAMQQTMEYLRRHHVHFSELYSTADYDTQATSKDIFAVFNRLECIVATDFLLVMSAFFNGVEKAEADVSDAAVVAAAKKEEEERTCVFSSDGVDDQLFPYAPLQMINAHLKQQKLFLLDDDDGRDGYDGHTVCLDVTSKVRVLVQGSTTMLFVEGKSHVVSGPLDNPQTQVVPNLALTATVKALGDTELIANVNIEDLNAEISLGDLNLLSRIAQAVSTDEAGEKQWDQHPKAIRKVKKGDEDGVPAGGTALVRREHALIRINSTSITLVDDLKVKSDPILIFSFKCDLNAENWSTKPTANADMVMAAATYNWLLGTWEPLMLAEATAKDQVGPVQLHMDVLSPDTMWVPNRDGGIGVKCMYANKSSKQPAKNMLDDDQGTFWDAGNKLTNYAVFDFGRSVKILCFKYKCHNNKAYAPKKCDLYVGPEPDPKSKKWAKVLSFKGTEPDQDPNKRVIQFESEAFNVRGRYMRWVIHDRHARGAARVTDVYFEISGEGSIVNIQAASQLEFTLSAPVVRDLQVHMAKVGYGGNIERQSETGGVTHEVHNYTHFPLAISRRDETKSVTIVPIGGTEKVNLSVPQTLRHELRQRAVEYKMEAITKLVQSGEGDETATFEIDGWLPLEDVQVSTVPSVQYFAMMPDTQASGVRVAVSVSQHKSLKSIIVSSPMAVFNGLDFPLAFMCTVSPTPAAQSGGILVDPGTYGSFPVGVMDAVDTSKMVQLLRFVNVVTGEYFYTTDALDIQFLDGDTWEEEYSLGFISVDAIKDTHALHAAIPCADREVSVVELANSKGKVAASGTRVIGHAYPFSKKLSGTDGYNTVYRMKDSNALVVASTDATSVNSCASLEAQGAKALFHTMQSSNRIQVRPKGGMSWGSQWVHPRKSLTGATTHIVSCAGAYNNKMDAILSFALRREPSTSVWAACPILSVENTLPYPMFVGLSDFKDKAPKVPTLVKAGEKMPIKFLGYVGSEHEVYLCMSLPSLVVDGDARVDMASLQWGTGVRVDVDPASSEKVLADDHARITMLQGDVHYHLRLNITVADVLAKKISDALNHIVISCPNVVYNTSGVDDLDVVMLENPKNPNVVFSLWKPNGANSDEPFLFSPFSGDCSMVQFATKTQGTKVVPLYMQVGIHGVDLTSAEHENLKWASPLVTEKFKATGTNVGGTPLQVNTSWKWNDSRMLFRKITINPRYLFVNNTSSKIRVVHRTLVDTRALRLINDGSSCALHSHVKPVDAHENEVTAFEGRDGNDLFEVNLIKPTESAMDVAPRTVNGNLVTYGSAVRFRHRITGTFLHARCDKGTAAGLRVSALECADDDDSASFWIVRPPFGTDVDDATYIDRALRSGDKIRVQHQISGAYLRVHQSESIKSKDQRLVTAVPEKDISASDNWTVETGADKLLAGFDDGKFKHDFNQKALEMKSPDDVYSEWVNPGDVHRINTSLGATSQVCVESNGRTTTPFTPETQLAGRTVLKLYPAAGDFSPRSGAVTGEGRSMDAVDPGFKTLDVFCKSNTCSYTVQINDHSHAAPFRFDNICEKVTVDFWQRNAMFSPIVHLKPHHQALWAPDDAAQTDEQVVLSLTDPMSDTPTLAVVSLSMYTSREIVCGDWTVVVVPHKDETTGTKVFALAPSIAAARVYFGLAPQIPPETLLTSVQLTLPGVGLSMIAPATANGIPAHEIMYMSLKQVQCSIDSTTDFSKSRVSVQDVQIDYCDYNSDSPVLLHRTVEPGANKKELERPFLQLTSINRLGQTGGANGRESVEYFAFLMQEFDLRVDGSSIPRLIDFASAASDVDDFTQTIMAEKTTDVGVVIEEEKYYKQFLLQPIKLTVTLTNSPGGQLTWLPTLDNFKIHLSSVEISNQTLVNSQLSQNISDLVSKRVLEYMYKGGVIRGIGSLAILGNPEATLTTIAGGFKSLLINPAKAAVQGPEEFGKSVATGTVGFGKAAIGGATGMASKITGATGSALSKLTLDEDFEKQRRKDLRETKGIASGVGTGFKRFGKGLFEGVTGVVVNPIKEGKKSGVKGVFKGIGTGITGLVFKPAAGVIDLASSTMSGVEAAMGTQAAKHLHTRPIRHIGPSGSITPYSVSEAMGARFLGERFPHLARGYVTHVMDQAAVEDDGYSMVFVCQSSLLHIVAKDPTNVSKTKCSLINVLPFRDMIAHESSASGIVFKYADGTSRTITCPEPSAKHINMIMLSKFARVQRQNRSAASTSHVQKSSHFRESHQGADAPTATAESPLPSSVTPPPATPPAAPEIKDVRIWERERYYPIKGWTHGLLPTDPKPWCNVDTNEGHKKRDDHAPPPGWAWVGPWTLEPSDRKDGWEYAMDWPRSFHKKKSLTDYVRRRTWTRQIKNVSDRRGSVQARQTVAYSANSSSA